MSSVERRTLHGVQVLRGVAAMMVVVLHVCLFITHNRDSLVPAGAAGVDIFFAISGAVMALSAPALAPGDFMLRRVVRIVPLWWFFLMLKLAQMTLAGGSARLGNLSATYVLASFLFVPAYDPSGQALPLILVGWTLNYEMAFYFVCTLALVISPRHFVLLTSAIIICAVLAGPALRAMTGQQMPAAVVLLSPLLLEFVGGMAAARLWLRGFGQPATVSLVGLGIAVSWLATVPEQHIYAPMRPLVWGLPAVAILWCVLALEKKLPFGRMSKLLLIGDASYAVYLAHTAVIPVMGNALHLLLGPVPAPLVALLLTAASLYAGIVVHLLIEKPLVRRLARTLGARQARIEGHKL